MAAAALLAFLSFGPFATRPRFSVYRAAPVDEIDGDTFKDPTIRIYASVYVTFVLGAATTGS